MFTPLDRYDEFNAANLNARLAQLEAGWHLYRDPMEIITETTLTASTDIISIDVVGSEWDMLHLTTTLTLNGTNPALRMNHDVNTNYGWGYFRAGVNWVGQAGSPAPSPTGIRLDTSGTTVTQSQLDLWITFAPSSAFLNVMVLGQGFGVGTNNNTFHVGGHYRYALTSLQLSFFDTTLGYLYSAGSTYRLEGIRA